MCRIDKLSVECPLMSHTIIANLKANVEITTFQSK